MATTLFDIPTMFGDHHVIEVRRLLLSLPGVNQVYASSNFQVVEIDYDPSQLQPETIETTLAKAGYMGELTMATETGVAAIDVVGGAFFRHTTAHAAAGKTVSFAQQVTMPKVGTSQNRPLWPCPGVGVLSNED